jgi:hypothetical protein
MTQTSAELREKAVKLTQKAAGFMLASANAEKREMKNQTVPKMKAVELTQKAAGSMLASANAAKRGTSKNNR